MVGKIDLAGNLLWTRKFQYAHVRDLAVGEDGVYIVGRSNDDVDFDLDNLGQGEIAPRMGFVAKFNATGGFEWAIPIAGLGAKSVA